MTSEQQTKLLAGAVIVASRGRAAAELLEQHGEVGSARELRERVDSFESMLKSFCGYGLPSQRV